MKNNFDLTRPWIGAVPIESVLPNPDQPRTHFDDEELRRTAESLRDMQIQPVLVIPHEDKSKPSIGWMIVDGERRLRGSKLIGKTEILVCYQPGITRENLHSKSFAANFCRVGHNHADTARAIDRERKAGKSYEQIASMVGKTAAWANNEHTTLKLHPKLLALLDLPDKNKRMSLKVALVLADMPHDQQLRLWERFKKHSAVDQFTKLRHCADVRHAPDSNRNDDRYCLRLMEGIVKRCFTVADVPRALLKNLQPATFSQLRKQLGEAEKNIATIRERLEKAAEGKFE